MFMKEIFEMCSGIKKTKYYIPINMSRISMGDGLGKIITETGKTALGYIKRFIKELNIGSWRTRTFQSQNKVQDQSKSESENKVSDQNPVKQEIMTHKEALDNCLKNLLKQHKSNHTYIASGNSKGLPAPPIPELPPTIIVDGEEVSIDSQGKIINREEL